MSQQRRSMPMKPLAVAVRAAAFDMSPDPSLVIGGEGELVAANEAAEGLFGRGLSLLMRGSFRDALPVGSSLVALINVTATAAQRDIVVKFDAAGTLREWAFDVDSADKLVLNIFDESVDIIASRTSDSAITMGSWRVFGASYDGTGGATAANGITLHQDGVVIASTATNNASYVAMENLALVVEIGSQNVGAANFFDGSMALVAVCAGALTTAKHLAITHLCRRFFGVPA